MAGIAQEIFARIDVLGGMAVMTQRAPLGQGDENADRMVAELRSGKDPLELTGLGASGSFTRADGYEVPLSGTVEGNRATVTFNAHCYTQEGTFTARMKLTHGEQERTIMTVTGRVSPSGSGPVVDVENVIPSIEDIIAQYDAMREAVQEAAQAAEEAREETQAVQAVREEAEAALADARAGAEAAEGWAQAEITASGLAAGSAPTAGMTTAADGRKVIALGIPKGDTGATPQITFRVATGAAGSSVEIEQSGTAENPVILLTIPRGDTGAVDGIDYYEGMPEAPGTASPGTANGVARGNHVHPYPARLTMSGGNAYAVVRSTADNRTKSISIMNPDTGEEVDLYIETSTDGSEAPVVRGKNASGSTRFYKLYSDLTRPTAQDVGARPDTWIPTAEQVGAMAMTKVLGSATYAQGAQVTFDDAPDNYRYFLGRVAYKGTPPATLNGSQDARILTLTSVSIDDGKNAITTTVNLVGTQGGTAFTVNKIVQTKVALDTGAVTVAQATSVQIGDLYGVK